MQEIAKPLGTRAARPHLLEKCGRAARTPSKTGGFAITSKEEKMTERRYNDHPRLSDESQLKFCPLCGAPLVQRYLDEERHARKVCSVCGFIFYLNPKMAAAVVPREGDKIWLLRRNIPPGDGSWTFPGGYVDMGESVPEAAIREAFEETGLNVRLDGLLNIYSYADIGIALIVYRGTVVGGKAALSPESREVRAFNLDDIPWDDLAFKSTREALRDYLLSVQMPVRGGKLTTNQ